MELKDLLLTPLYLLLIYCGLYLYKSTYLKTSLLRKYFIPAISFKFIGAISIGLLYQFYYRSGDTYSYFTHGSQHIWDAFWDSPSTGLSLIFGDSGDYTIDSGIYSGNIWLFRDSRSYMVIRLSALIGIFTYHTYSVNALFFTLISFSGIWSLFKVFCEINPKLTKHFAIAILFLPTLIFWGSGLMKDSLCFCALGWFVSSCYYLLIKRKYNIKHFIFLGLGYFILASIKPYIIFCFIIALGVWVTVTYINKLKNTALKILTIVGLVIIGSIVLYVSISTIEQEIAEISEEARIKAGWIQYMSMKEEGAIYTFSSNFDGSIGSFMRLAPEAFFTTWFRPFIFEAHNPLSLLMSLESMVFLFYFFVLFTKLRNYKYFNDIEKGFFWMAIVFAIFFGIIVGISTGNFGSLQRYKVPGMPLLLSAFFMLIYKKKSLAKKT